MVIWEHCRFSASTFTWPEIEQVYSELDRSRPWAPIIENKTHFRNTKRSEEVRNSLIINQQLTKYHDFSILHKLHAEDVGLTGIYSFILLTDWGQVQLLCVICCLLYVNSTKEMSRLLTHVFYSHWTMAEVHSIPFSRLIVTDR